MRTINLALTIYSILFLVTTYQAVAQKQQLSGQAVISLVTADPGEELYSLFGHSAIRVKDTVNSQDLVFNYGTFNFNTPNFYMKFTRGKLLYMLSIQQFDRFKRSYEYEKRDLKEQILNLTQDQKQAIFQFLLWNYQPENRYYKYDFFFDNCATRIRDVFIDELPGLNFQFEYVKEGASFRDLIDEYLIYQPWSDFGIDIALGLPTDQIADPSQYMFLPDYMYLAFEKATISAPDASKVNFVSSTKTIYDAPARPYQASKITDPISVFGFVFILVLIATFYCFRKKWNGRWIDVILFSVVGITGLIIVFLWFFTDHIATKGNLNIIWAFPLHLPMVWLLLFKKFRNASRKYFKVVSLVLVLFLMLWFVLPQQFHVAFVPIVLTMLLRSVYISFVAPKNYLQP
jgi:hypothetical protein